MCSKKVAGIALVVTGAILIVIGIIVGVLLPNVAQKATEGQTCVNNEDSPGYKRWEGPTDLTTKVYIWNITNKDGFLYRGEKPKLEEKGPYVYSTKSKNVNVKFENGKVTSTPFEQAKFNKTLTEKECPTCTAHDKLTVLNTAYLALMQKTGSEIFFGTASIPLVLPLLFQGLGNKTHALNVMGQTQNQLGFQPSSSPAFGAWFASNFPHLSRNFSLGEMSGLYGTLTNPSKFGPFTTNSTLHAECTKLNASSKASKACGIVHNLLVLTRDLVNASQVIHELLCPLPSSSCFNTTNNIQYLLAIGDFIRDVLPRFVLGYLESNNFGLTSTLNQTDIVLGYVMDKLRLPQYPKGIPIPGSVTSHEDEETAKKQRTNSTFYTCESTERDWFTYAAIGGQTKTNKTLYPAASEEQLKVRGYYVQFPGQKSLKPCKTNYDKMNPSYELYMSRFRFAVPIEYKEDVKVHSIPMHRYVLGDNALKVNNVTVLTRGVFDVTRILQGPMYISLPGFLHGEPMLYQDLNLPKPDLKKYESFLSIEPISGTAMELKLRIQLNAIIPRELLSPNHANVSYVNKLIPIWWSETSAGIDAGTAEEFSSKLFGSLRLSCGLLVALNVIGGLILIVGVVLIVLAVCKKGASVTTA